MKLIRNALTSLTSFAYDWMTAIVLTSDQISLIRWREPIATHWPCICGVYVPWDYYLFLTNRNWATHNRYCESYKLSIDWLARLSSPVMLSKDFCCAWRNWQKLLLQKTNSLPRAPVNTAMLSLEKDTRTGRGCCSLLQRRIQGSGTGHGSFMTSARAIKLVPR